ncbi:hypothetical protein ACVBEF_11230 [Glaciimonas sp. GG7]
MARPHLPCPAGNERRNKYAPGQQVVLLVPDQPYARCGIACKGGGIGHLIGPAHLTAVDHALATITIYSLLSKMYTAQAIRSAMPSVPTCVNRQHILVVKLAFPIDKESSMKRFTLLLTLAAIVSILLGGCVVEPYGDGYRHDGGNWHDHDHDRGGQDRHY